MQLTDGIVRVMVDISYRSLLSDLVYDSRSPDKVTPEAACTGFPSFFLFGFRSASSRSSLLGKAQSLRRCRIR